MECGGAGGAVDRMTTDEKRIRGEDYLETC